MKKDVYGNNLIVATDEYFDAIHGIWRTVPKFWIGDIVESHNFDIRSKK